MDIASIIGIGAALFLMINGMGGVGALMETFIDMPSVFITFGGAFGTILAMNTLKGFLAGLKSYLLIFKTPKSSEIDTIKSIIDLSNLARREGLLALEESANSLDDEFMKKGVMLIVDGTDPELVRSILEAELINVDTRHQSNIGFWKDVASMGPAWGMIGTLIGLILMLFGAILGIRFLILMLIGEGDGHVQSLILTAILIMMGFQTITIGLLGDTISANRKLLEDVQYRVRKMECGKSDEEMKNEKAE